MESSSDDGCHDMHPCALRRVIRKVPESVEAFQDAAAKLLADRHHGVLLTGVTLMLEVCAVEPAAVEAYTRHVPSLCKVLRSLLMSGFSPEHDVSGITDPFLQIQVRSTSCILVMKEFMISTCIESHPGWNTCQHA